MARFFGLRERQRRAACAECKNLGGHGATLFCSLRALSNLATIAQDFQDGFGRLVRFHRGARNLWSASSPGDNHTRSAAAIPAIVPPKATVEPNGLRKRPSRRLATAY